MTDHDTKTIPIGQALQRVVSEFRTALDERAQALADLRTSLTALNAELRAAVQQFEAKAQPSTKGDI